MKRDFWTWFRWSASSLWPLAVLALAPAGSLTPDAGFMLLVASAAGMAVSP